MSTPDKFFHINPDVKPGAIHRDDPNNYRVYKPENPPNSSKNFEKILDKEHEKPADDVNETAKKAPGTKEENALKDPTTSKEKKLEAFVKETSMPEIDPRFNQAPTLGKDSKIAPKLGKELLIAPADEPRAMGFVEEAPKEKGKVTLPGEQLLDKGKTEEGVVKALPTDDLAMKLPKDRTKEEITKPENLSKDAKMTTDQQAVNLMSSQTNETQIPLTKTAPTAKPVQSAEQIRELANQIADKITITKTTSQVDTSVKLTNIPKFEGVTVTVTTYPTAKGEINITFENLTQEGKMILDMADNRAALRQSLDQRGYIVHMVTTTTTTIEKNYAESSTAGKDSRGDTDEQLAGGDKKQQQQDEEQA